MEPPIPGARLSGYVLPGSEAWARRWTAEVALRSDPPLESTWVPTSLGSTHVLRSAPTGEGPEVVFLPGWGTSGAFWAVAGRLSEIARRRRVALVDLPGHPGLGTGWAPPHRPDGYASWLGEVLSGLESPKVALVGFSFGGFVAARGAGLLGGRVVRLVLVAPAGFVWPRADPGVVAAVLAHRFRPTRRSAARFVRTCLHRPEQGVEPRTRQEIEEALFRFGVGFRNRTRIPPLLSDADLAGIGQPTLLVCGSGDRIFSAARTVRRARRLLPDLRRVETLAGHGHGLEVSPRTAALVAGFLS